MTKIYELGIIGLGPSGIGAALGVMNVNASLLNSTICFEAGNNIADRTCNILEDKNYCDNKQCSIISGIGGSSLVSSGKISNFKVLPFVKTDFEKNKLIPFLVV